MSRKWKFEIHKPFCLRRSLKTEEGNPGKACCVVWALMWPCCDCHPYLYKWWCMGHDVISLPSARPTQRLTLIMYKIKHNHGERHTSCFYFFFSRLFTVWSIGRLPQSSFITFSNFDPQSKPVVTVASKKSFLDSQMTHSHHLFACRPQTDGNSAFNDFPVKVGARSLSHKVIEGEYWESHHSQHSQPAKHTNSIFN